jgi:predicted ArsR family transcriptional regulator
MIENDSMNNNFNDDKPRHSYNEIKYRILELLQSSSKELSPQDIAIKVGTTLDGAKQRLRLLSKLGYVWRKVETRTGRKNYYSYRRLKSKGKRIFLMLDERVKIREATGVSISLNLNKPIPDFAQIEYKRIMKK